MLFEMLTGQMPFQGGSVYALAAARLNAPPPNPRALDAALPEWLTEVVVRCLARDPADRWHSAEHVMHALRSRIATLPQSGLERAPDSALAHQNHVPTARAKDGSRAAVQNAGATDGAYRRGDRI
jgi:serine/threonine protein kinase